MIVLSFYANKLVILCNSENAALEASIFRAIPGSGKFNYFLNIKLTDFYNQYFFVFGGNSKLKVGSYHAEFKMQRNAHEKFCFKIMSR